MVNLKKSILAKSAIVLFIGLGVSIFLLENMNPTTTRWFLILVPAITFLINFLAFAFMSGKKAPKSFSTLITSLFGIKFFSYLVLALAYFLIEQDNDQRMVFIGFLFIIYFLNTVVLLRTMMRHQKHNN